MATGAELKGAQDFNAKLLRLAGKLGDVVGKALYAETQVEATEVKKRTPVWNSDRRVPPGETPGALRASVHVVGPIREGKRVYTLIVAGGSSAPYAVYVHEDLEAFHKVGQAKFLESVIMESRAYMAARVAKRVDLKDALE